MAGKIAGAGDWAQAIAEISWGRIAMAALMAGFLLALFLAAAAWAGAPQLPDPITVHVFYDHDIHFAPADSSRYDTGAVTATHGGRVITRMVELPRCEYPVRITATVAVRPIAKDETDVHDRWDRAGNVRLRVPGRSDVEIVKFITAYGGATEYQLDVTELGPLLTGRATFHGFIDTWVSPAWKMDFSLCFAPLADSLITGWVEPVFYEESLTAERLRGDGVLSTVEIPPSGGRVVLRYLASGHCTDGRGADEFETRDHVITVDGREVARLRPWRADCKQFRAVNPYCRRWSDGSWSADYSRSGWCPGDQVLPEEVDLSSFLEPGRHTLGVNVRGVRPKGEDGHFGYWRVSAALVGYSRP